MPFRMFLSRMASRVIFELFPSRLFDKFPCVSCNLSCGDLELCAKGCCVLAREVVSGFFLFLYSGGSLIKDTFVFSVAVFLSDSAK